MHWLGLATTGAIMLAGLVWPTGCTRDNPSFGAGAETETTGGESTTRPTAGSQSGSGESSASTSTAGSDGSTTLTETEGSGSDTWPGTGGDVGATGGDPVEQCAPRPGYLHPAVYDGLDAFVAPTMQVEIFTGELVFQEGSAFEFEVCAVCPCTDPEPTVRTFDFGTELKLIDPTTLETCMRVAMIANLDSGEYVGFALYPPDGDAAMPIFAGFDQLEPILPLGPLPTPVVGDGHACGQPLDGCDLARVHGDYELSIGGSSFVPAGDKQNVDIATIVYQFRNRKATYGIEADTCGPFYSWEIEQEPM